MYQTRAAAMTSTSYLPQTLNETLVEYEEAAASLYGESAAVVVKQEPGCASPCLGESRQPKVYMDLSAPTMLLHKHAKTEYPETLSSLLSWTTKHPENWTRREVLDWLYYTAQEHRFDGARVCGEAYQQLCGRDLCRLSRSEMQTLDPAYGAKLFDLLAALLDHCGFQEPPRPETFNPEMYTSIFDASTALESGCGDYELPDVPSNEADLSVFVDGDAIQVDLAGHLYDIDVDLAAKLHLPDHVHSDGGYVSGDSEMEYSASELSRYHSHDSDVFGESLLMSDEEEERVTARSLPPPARTPSVSSEEGARPSPPEQRRRSGKRSAPKGNHLWEFIRDALKNPQFNPSLLRWEDREDGVFKFVQSEAVATMWGRQKNNPAMTYEKLSRAMRFCRSAGYFADVPKNGKFPKKLCFRFGPKAFGWQQ